MILINSKFSDVENIIALKCNVALQWGRRGRIDFYARVARSILTEPREHKSQYV